MLVSRYSGLIGVSVAARLAQEDDSTARWAPTNYRHPRRRCVHMCVSVGVVCAHHSQMLYAVFKTLLQAVKDEGARNDLIQLLLK